MCIWLLSIEIKYFQKDTWSQELLMFPHGLSLIPIKTPCSSQSCVFLGKTRKIRLFIYFQPDSCKHIRMTWMRKHFKPPSAPEASREPRDALSCASGCLQQVYSPSRSKAARSSTLTRNWAKTRNFSKNDASLQQRSEAPSAARDPPSTSDFFCVNHRCRGSIDAVSPPRRST